MISNKHNFKFLLLWLQIQVEIKWFMEQQILKTGIFIISPVLSLVRTFFCISSTFCRSLWYCSSANCKSLFEEAKLAFFASKAFCRSAIARSRSQQDCFNVATSELRDSCFCWLFWLCSICAWSFMFKAASWACSSVFSLRAWMCSENQNAGVSWENILVAD